MYVSAGILPYAVVDKEVFLLLGCDASEGGVWSDFGGKAETEDRNDPTRTASREFMEETLGAVMTAAEMRELLIGSVVTTTTTDSAEDSDVDSDHSSSSSSSARASSSAVVRRLQGATFSGQLYYMYVVPVAWSPCHAAHFRKTLGFLRHAVHNTTGAAGCSSRKLSVIDHRRFFEKTHIRWFSARDVLLSGRCDGARLRRVFADTLVRHKHTLTALFRSVVEEDQ